MDLMDLLMPTMQYIPMNPMTTHSLKNFNEFFSEFVSYSARGKVTKHLIIRELKCGSKN